MAHTEAQIRRAIKPLLTVYGELNTTEVKNLLEKHKPDIFFQNVLCFEQLTIINRISPNRPRPGTYQ